ncbi:MAG: YlxM family DNA-binding protein [Clostridia bacterium]|nr:YlxM family DNA-binding protein [Clostridia bacterium]
MSVLFDYYGELLTEKQKELFDLYYNDDLSLSEISEIVGISRQGVRDAIVRAESALRDAEDKIGLVEKYMGLHEKLGQISDCAGYIAQVNASGVNNPVIAAQAKKIAELVGEIK